MISADLATMKRQKKYNTLENENEYVTMERINQPKFENLLEAEVQDGDTLQALALRFHCTVAEIKRLNKIDKDNEMYARKIIKVPVTRNYILLESFPTVHKSGQNSPKHKDDVENLAENLLCDKQLDEKLLIASVNSAELEKNGDPNNSINDIILNSRLRHNTSLDSCDAGDALKSCDPFLSGELDETVPQPRPIPGPSKGIIDFSGSDCDISWICLFICILALCFAIPLVYVFYIAEHLEKFHHNSN